jgi:hypothetical protein
MLSCKRSQVPRRYVLVITNVVSRIVLPTSVKSLPGDPGYIGGSIEVTGNQYRCAHRGRIYKYVIGR